MNISPELTSRRKSRQIHVGKVAVGGDAPVSVQTMTKTDTRDVDATLMQIREVQALSCDIVRVAVVDEAAAKALSQICSEVTIPVIADIHYDHKLAVQSIEAGVAGLRINPGNIGSENNVNEVVAAARDHNVPIRIGVNSGSLDDEVHSKYGNTAEALVESALKHVAILEKKDFYEIKISVKASDFTRTVQAYRLLAQNTEYPIHLGVTEAGTFLAGTVRSTAAIALLLTEGIGDTLRVSLTDTPANEVRVGLELLRSLGLREPGPSVISCPTCGRVEVDVVSVAKSVESELEKYYAENPDASRPVVAVMGCMVNGPGEAREADIAAAGGKKKFVIYVNGKPVDTVSEKEVTNRIVEHVRQWQEPK